MQNKVIYLDIYRKHKKQNKKLDYSTIDIKSDIDDEERIKTLNLFIKVITTMYKESYK